jgi:hypothetical protein
LKQWATAKNRVGTAKNRQDLGCKSAQADNQQKMKGLLQA